MKVRGENTLLEWCRVWKSEMTKSGKCFLLFVWCISFYLLSVILSRLWKRKKPENFYLCFAFIVVWGEIQILQVEKDDFPFRKGNEIFKSEDKI